MESKNEEQIEYIDLNIELNEKGIEQDIQKMTNSINSAYRISKMNFIFFGGKKD